MILDGIGPSWSVLDRCWTLLAPYWIGIGRHWLLIGRHPPLWGNAIKRAPEPNPLPPSEPRTRGLLARFGMVFPLGITGRLRPDLTRAQSARAGLARRNRRSQQIRRPRPPLLLTSRHNSKKLMMPIRQSHTVSIRHGTPNAKPKCERFWTLPMMPIRQSDAVSIRQRNTERDNLSRR
jgi:hypothetical protein